MDFGNLKEIAAQARATRNGKAAGNYRSKLITNFFEKDDTGRDVFISEWVHLQVYGANEGSTLEDCLKTVNKKVQIKIYVSGKGSEFGKIKMASLLEEILKGTPFNLEDYKTSSDFNNLFMQLNAYTVIRELVGKFGTNKKFLNWYVRRDREAASPNTSAPAGNAGWTTQAPPVQQAPVQTTDPAPVPTPVPTPAPALAPAPEPVPQSAASALFG